MVATFLLVPASFVPLGIAGGGPLIVVPYQHFYLVSTVSLPAALVAYGGIAVKTWILAELPYSVPPYSTGLAIASIVLFFLAAAGQARTYRLTRLESQASLIAAFVLLAEGMAAMVLFPVWSWG